MRSETASLLAALEEKYGDGNVMHGKGGFFVRGRTPSFLTVASARQETGVAATPRQRRPAQAPWGDYATVAMMNRRRRNPRQIDSDDTILMDVWLEDEAGKWQHEATCTLADFFRENDAIDRKTFRPSLFMVGQYVERDADPAWKISFHK